MKITDKIILFFMRSASRGWLRTARKYELKMKKSELNVEAYKILYEDAMEYRRKLLNKIKFRNKRFYQFRE